MGGTYVVGGVSFFFVVVVFVVVFVFFFNDTATTEIYTLSLHDALPISRMGHPLAISVASSNESACTIIFPPSV